MRETRAKLERKKEAERQARKFDGNGSGGDRMCEEATSTSAERIGFIGRKVPLYHVHTHIYTDIQDKYRQSKKSKENNEKYEI